MKQGTSRKERALGALNPSSFSLDSRTLREIYEDTRAFAKTVSFEDEKGSYNWQAMFDEGLHYMRSLEEGSLEPSLLKECPPHLALFFSFIKLFHSVQSQFNSLTEEQLLFFYKKILKQQTYPMLGDAVYIFIDLARNEDKFHLKEGSGFFAGKDTNKNDIVYKTVKDVFLNKATVAKYCAIYNSKNNKESLYVFDDVQQIGLGKEGIDIEDESAVTKGWYPFGNPQLLRESAQIGFGIQAPILHLEEGNRSIELAITLADTEKQAPTNILWNPAVWEVHLSTSAGLLVKPVKAVNIKNGVLLFKVELSKLDPPIASALDENAKDSILPSAKFILSQGYSHSHYAQLQKLRVKQLTVNVKVEGAENLKVYNDYGILDVGQAFQPFGFTPVVGSNMFVQAPEMARKNINRANLNFEWKGLPENFKAYYEGYLGHTNSLVEKIEDFKVSVALRKNKEWEPIKNKTETLFELFQEKISFQISPDMAAPVNERYNPDNGTIKISFAAPKRAFGHSLYPSVYTKAIMAQVQLKDEPIPNPPYTPTVENIKLDYEASEVFNQQHEDANSGSFFHIEPFGFSTALDKEQTPSLIPPWYNAGGQLYLGIDRLNPPEQLNLFFEIRAENILDRPNVQLSYLTKAGWKKFSKNQLLSDATNGLKQTGIITLNVPGDATAHSKQMPAGLHWIKLETAAFPERFDQIVSLRTNAVVCALNSINARPDYAVNKLAPNTISSLIEKKNQIKKIEQPYRSFGGRPMETREAFFVRISEQMAHKNKGVTSWDIEHLVLQNFEEIYQVVCNPHTNYRGETTSGAFHVITIPKVQTVDPMSIRKPLASAALLDRIKAYLLECVSPHVDLSVANPDYDVLQVQATVSFMDHVDAGYYLKKLESDLKKFLSPWAFDRDQKLEMGTTLYKSSLIKFIEHQPYINFIAQIKLYKNNIAVETNEVYTAKHAILISADKHHIDTVEPNTLVCQTNQGIAQMIVDINFQVE